MALSISQKSSIESYKNQIQGLKNEIQRFRLEKKKVSERISRELKNAKDAKEKESIRKSKATSDHQIKVSIESLTKSIERTRGYIQDIRSRA